MSATVLHFPLREVALTMTTTVEAGAWTDSYTDSEAGRRTGPALVFVKDQGVYLMGNERPRVADLVYARAEAADGRELRLPERYDDDPATWDEVYSLARELCGGDDFAEYLPLTPDLRAAIQSAADRGLRSLVIALEGDSMAVEVQP